jgi:hypothetical protein
MQSGIYITIRDIGGKRLMKIEREHLPAFIGGTFRMLYRSTDVEWWGRIKRIWLEGTPNPDSENKVVYIEMVDDIVERQGGSDWKPRPGTRNYSFSQAPYVIVIDAAGPHKSIIARSQSQRITIFSPSHPKETKVS